jgi:hypothetical protein
VTNAIETAGVRKVFDGKLAVDGVTVCCLER